MSTPGRLATLIKSKAIDTSKVSGVVLDEVDVLLIDDTFGPQLRTLGNVFLIFRESFLKIEYVV